MHLIQPKPPPKRYDPNEENERPLLALKVDARRFNRALKRADKEARIREGEEELKFSDDEVTEDSGGGSEEADE